MWRGECGRRNVECGNIRFRISEYRFGNAEWISKGQREYAGRLGSLEGESQKRLKAESSKEGLWPLEAGKQNAELLTMIPV